MDFPSVCEYQAPSAPALPHAHVPTNHPGYLHAPNIRVRAAQRQTNSPPNHPPSPSTNAPQKHRSQYRHLQTLAGSLDVSPLAKQHSHAAARSLSASPSRATRGLNSASATCA